MYDLSLVENVGVVLVMFYSYQWFISGDNFPDLTSRGRGTEAYSKVHRRAETVEFQNVGVAFIIS